MQTVRPRKVSVPKVAAPVRLLGGTERKGAEGHAKRGAEGQRGKGAEGRMARRGKGPHAVVFVGEDGDKWGAEPGLGRRANRREVATCADPRVVRVVPCVTVWERAHEIRQYDKDARVEMLVPNFVGRGRNVQPFPGSRPRLYPERELTARGSQGEGGHSPDAVYDETEMRRRRMDAAMGVRGAVGMDGAAGGEVAVRRDAAFVVLGAEARERTRQVTRVRADLVERAAHRAHESAVRVFLEGGGS